MKANKIEGKGVECMDLKIDDLKISEYIKNILHEPAFTKVSLMHMHQNLPCF